MALKDASDKSMTKESWTNNAIFWLKRASDQDHKEAQYALGLLYLDKNYFPENIEETKSFLELMKNQGHLPAKKTLFKLNQCAKIIQKTVRDR